MADLPQGETMVSRARGMRLQKFVLAFLISLVVVPLSLIVTYSVVNPPITTLMLGNIINGNAVHQTWVPLEKISPHLIRAVLANEDQRFCKHWGVDWTAVESALEEAGAKGTHPRGASTISMQTAKNLFLWPQRSYIRKAIEIPFAYMLTAIWTRRRLVEIYLNIVEWAPGIYGAESAAFHHFYKKANRLTQREAALLAAALPNPHVRNAGKAGPKTKRLASRIQLRIAKIDPQFLCIK